MPFATAARSIAHAVSPLQQVGAATLAEMALDFAHQGDTEGLAHLCDVGVSPDLADTRGRRLLAIAAARGDAVMVQMLLDRGAKPLPAA